MEKAYALLLILFVLAPTINIVLVKGAGTGYLAIKDYLGNVWSIQDVEKIINYYYETTDGKNASLADYFWIVVDDNPENKYNLGDFIASPLDGKTAVLPLPAGDHYVDIYWFGYHQRVLVNIVENQHYVLNLETAPVVPFKTAGEPPSSAEWDLAANPEGLTIQRRDGKAWVRFNYDQSFITVAWYDEDTGWNYQALDVYIDTNYQYKFHVKDPSNPEYYEEGTGSFLWLSWDLYKVKEEVKWNRTGEILHVAYIVAIAENEGLLKGAWEFWDATAKTIIANALGYTGLIDPVTWTVVRLNAFTEYVQSAYDTYIGEFYASKYQKTVLLVWDVFATPTQVVVLAHAYDVQQDGTVVEKPITSANAFTINNRLVYVKQLSGGVEYQIIDNHVYTFHFSIGNTNIYITQEIKPYYKVDIGGRRDCDWNNPRIKYPGGDYFRFSVDDLSKYRFEYWFKIEERYRSEHNDEKAYAKYVFKVIITFNDTSKANMFEQILNNNGITYTRSENSFTITAVNSGQYTVSKNTYTTRSYIVTLDNINGINLYDLIPPNSSGYIQFLPGGYVKGYNGPYLDGGCDEVYYDVRNIYVRMVITPKMTPPQVSLLKDGYQTVSGAFAVQVYTTLFREDSDAYLLGYYLLGNDPPPSFIIRDVHYDIENDLMHYVWTIITADAYGQDIVDMTSNTTTNANNETMYNYYLSIKPTVRTYDNVTLALFDYNRTAFLNLAPDIIQHLLAVPPVPGYGTPTVDWSKVQIITIDLTRPYKLYWLNNKTDEWVEVWPDYDSSTVTYYIKRASDNTTIETLPNGTISDYFYKLVYTDTNESYTGYLKNDNGTLKLIAVSVKWSLSPQELQLLLQQIQLHGIYDKWLEQWNQIAQQLGLVTQTLQNIASGITGAWDWLGNNWKWLLLGFGVFLVLIILLIAGAGRGGRVVVVHR